MSELFRFRWDAFDVLSGLKVAITALVVFGLMAITGESWIATGLILLFAWLTNVPGSLRDRLGGILAFAIGAIAITWLSGRIGLDLRQNTIAIIIIGFLATFAVAWGTRSYMVGYALICWAIYGPFMIASSSVMNCMLAILVGAGAIMITTIIGSLFEKDDNTSAGTDQEGTSEPDYATALPHAATVAIVLGLTTYLGWISLKTDPTMAVGAAFFIIGFDAKKTWIAGIARVVGIVAGIYLGYTVSQLVEPGLGTDTLAVGALFLSFAAMNVNPGLFMFFFIFMIALGWGALDPETLELTFRERLAGEGVGVVIAMIAIGILHRLQTRTQIE